MKECVYVGVKRNIKQCEISDFRTGLRLHIIFEM
jgi:hypothetical protein